MNLSPIKTADGRRPGDILNQVLDAVVGRDGGVRASARGAIEGAVSALLQKNDFFRSTKSVGEVERALRDRFREMLEDDRRVEVYFVCSHALFDRYVAARALWIVASAEEGGTRR